MFLKKMKGVNVTTTGKRVLTFLVALVFVSLASGVGNAKVEFIPLVNLSVFGGQYFFGSEPGSFGGNLNLDVTPAVKFGESSALLPSYYGGYRGVKDVTDLVGGGTLTQQSQDHTLSFKYIQKLGKDYKAKVKLGYRTELFRETLDETWTKGLFDYNKTSFGVEGERLNLGTVKNVLLGIGYFGFNFPNYQSLAEEKYGQELSGKIGKDVLNFTAVEVYVNSEMKFSESLDARVMYNLTSKSFGDQKIINDGPAYSTSLRQDLTQVVDGLASYSVTGMEAMKMSVGLTLQGVFNSSNQNHYDATRTKFVPGYYDYLDLKIGPVLSVGLTSMPLTATVLYSFANRAYSSRFVQDVAGTYGTDKTAVQTNVLRLGVEYGITKSLKVSLLVNYLNSGSNMKYEQVYKYNYSSVNYFLGLRWEY